MTRHGITELSDDLALQREFLAERVPLYARLLEGLEAALPHGLSEQLSERWAGREFSSVYERPLLILAALRYDALCDGAAHPLHRAIAQEPPELEAATAAALRAALAPERTRFWDAVASRYVQTNESSRAVSWLWPAHLMHMAAGWQRLALVDLGTSAGLNLAADALPTPWVRTDGAAFVLAPRPRVVRRIGLDRAPLDVRDPLTAHWLRACVWPGEQARQARLEQGIAAFTALSAGEAAPELVAVDLGAATDTLRTLPAELPVLAVQSIVRDYLPDALKARHRASMERWLGERPPASALWVELELEDGGTSADTAAAITAHLRGRDGALVAVQLARCHPHPAALQVDDAAVTRLHAAARG